MLKSKNMMEEITERVLNDHIDQLNLACKCDQCLRDIFAIALNHLPPKYIVQSDAEAYIKAQYLENQYHVNVLSELASAAVIVSNSPRH